MMIIFYKRKIEHNELLLRQTPFFYFRRIKRLKNKINYYRKKLLKLEIKMTQKLKHKQ